MSKMFSTSFFKRHVAVLTSCLILLIGMGPIGMTSAATANREVLVCVNKKSGAMRQVTKAKCAKTERLLRLTSGTEATTSTTVVTGPTGAKGDTGAAGATGAKGDTGAQGPAGPKGDAGAAGPIQSLNLTQWTLAAGLIGGGSESSSFGNLVAGKKYIFTITVNGRMGIDVTTFRSSPELKCSDGSAAIIYDYSYGFEPSFDGTGEYNRMSYIIVGSVSVASNSAFSVVVKDGRGTGKTVTLNGTAIIQEVGSIN